MYIIKVLKQLKKHRERRKKGEIFGMWADRKDMANVKKYVSNLRQGRKIL